MNVQELIQELRIKEDMDCYFDTLNEIVEGHFDEEDQETLYSAFGEIFESDELDIEQKMEIIDNVLTEAGAPSCQESRWKRPSQISWGARTSDKVGTPGANNWFETFPGKGKETR
jgi:hypothetical protein